MCEGRLCVVKLFTSSFTQSHNRTFLRASHQPQHRQAPEHRPDPHRQHRPAPSVGYADPGNPQNYELLGRYHLSLGHTSEAVAAFRKALSLSPQGAGAPYLLAKALLATRTDSARQEAKLLLTQSVAREPLYWEGSNVSPNGGAEDPEARGVPRTARLETARAIGKRAHR